MSLEEAAAWLFPGQGTQAVGMGRDLYQGSPAARAVIDLADQTLGFPLTRLLFEGPADELQSTINAQPAIVAVSLAALAAFEEAWRAEGLGDPPRPRFVAGHSVGEYAALVAGGAADVATGLRLVRARAEAMHAAGSVTPGTMTAILGLARDVVADACRRARQEVPGSYVDVANHNAETQVAIAGDRTGLDTAMRLCREAGARRCVPLSVSAAFHSAAMEPAREPLRRAVEAAPLRDARVPLLANVTTRPITTASDVRRELVEQVASPVLWADGMQAMTTSGVRAFVEFGAGNVLSNLAQRMDSAPEAISVGDAESARQAVTWVRERSAPSERSERGGS
jgi:[acyl-carrier-protein] S-malonyltransferase